MAAKRIKAKGRKVGAATRRVLLHGKPFVVPKFDEDISGTFVIERKIACYKVSQNSASAKVRRVFDVAKAYLPNNASQEFYIVDVKGYLDKIGKADIHIRKINDTNRASRLWSDIGIALGHRDSTGVSSTVLWEVMPTINPKKFFREYYSLWPDILDCYITEGCEKDVRIVDWLKAMVLPLIGRPEYWQKFNPHGLLITNTSSGKTFANILFGLSTSLDISVAGLFGANIDTETGKKQEAGVLASTNGGFFMIDEFEQLNKPYSKEIVTSLLSYMEQGTVSRVLSKGVPCEGTKTICFSSNPKSDDFYESFILAVDVLQGKSDLTRFAKRLGFFLMGNDFKQVESKNEITVLRDPVRRVLHYSLIMEKPRYLKLIRALSRMSCDDDEIIKSYRNTLIADSKLAVDENTKNFIYGLSLSGKKLKMASLLICFLENFNFFMVNRNQKQVLKKLTKNYRNVLERLCRANLMSVDKLIITDKERLSSKECALSLKLRFPAMSSRSISKFLGVSHTTIDKWLTEVGNEEEKTNSGEADGE